MKKKKFKKFLNLGWWWWWCWISIHLMYYYYKRPGLANSPPAQPSIGSMLL